MRLGSENWAVCDRLSAGSGGYDGCPRADGGPFPASIAVVARTSAIEQISNSMLTLRWTLCAKRACVWLRTPSLTGSLLSPASADGPPRGLVVAALSRRHG